MARLTQVSSAGPKRAKVEVTIMGGHRVKCGYGHLRLFILPSRINRDEYTKFCAGTLPNLYDTLAADCPWCRVPEKDRRSHVVPKRKAGTDVAV